MGKSLGIHFNAFNTNVRTYPWNIREMILESGSSSVTGVPVEEVITQPSFRCLLKFVMCLPFRCGVLGWWWYHILCSHTEYKEQLVMWWQEICLCFCFQIRYARCLQQILLKVAEKSWNSRWERTRCTSSSYIRRVLEAAVSISWFTAEGPAHSYIIENS